MKSAAAVSLTRAPTAHRPRKAAERAVRLAEKAKRKDGKDRARGTKSDGSGYLTMYFRDMAALHVLRPEEEFTTAKEIEALEVAVWSELLGWAPTQALVLDALPAEAAPAEVKALRRPLAGKKADAAVAKAAARLRDTDLDRLYIEAGLAVAERIQRGYVTVPKHGRTAKPLGEWLHRVDVAARAAHDARNAFVKANLRLVISIARRFNHGRMSLADLVQEGNLGLIKAVERYDYRRGFRFSTYASWWIRHAISRALADKGREIRLPVHMIDAHHRLTKARRELTTKLGRSPTTEELAETTGMPLDKVENMRRWVLEQSVSLDRPVGDEEGRSLAEVLEDPDKEDASPTADLEMDALQSEVRSILGELRPIEADILRQRFGLETVHELTLKEIGEKYNLSRERIRQLQEQALGKMRRALQRKDMM